MAYPKFLEWDEIGKKFKRVKPMATYDHIIECDSLSELEMLYYNLASSCFSRELELGEMLEKRDAAYLAWKNAGGYK